MATGDRIYLGGGVGATATTAPSDGQVMTANGWIDLNLGSFADQDDAEDEAVLRGGIIDNMFYWDIGLGLVQTRVAGSWRRSMTILTDEDLDAESNIYPPSQNAVKAYVEARERIGAVSYWQIEGNRTITPNSTGGGNTGTSFRFEAPLDVQNPRTGNNWNGGDLWNIFSVPHWIHINPNYVYLAELQVNSSWAWTASWARTGITAQGNYHSTANREGKSGSVTRGNDKIATGLYSNGSMAIAIVNGSSNYIGGGSTGGSAFITQGDTNIGKGYLKITCIGLI